MYDRSLHGRIDHVTGQSFLTSGYCDGVSCPSNVVWITLSIQYHNLRLLYSEFSINLHILSEAL